MTTGELDYRQLVESSPHACLVHVADCIVYANPAAAQMLRLTSPAEVGGRPLWDFAPQEAEAGLRSRLLRALTGSVQEPAVEERLLRADGTELRAETVAVRLPGAEAVQIICWDVTDRARTTEELAYRATHDTLTGLPNRALLWDRWEQARTRLRRSGGALTVILCDLDGFKDVNDVYGHVAGDEVLRQVARRLRAVLRGDDTLARVGGDEFVALVDGPDHHDEVTGRMRAAVADGVAVPGGVVRPGLSIGSVRDDPGSAMQEVLHAADLAMYDEKRRRRGDRG